MKKILSIALVAISLFVISCKPDGPFPGFESRPNGTWIKFHKQGESKDTAGLGGLFYTKIVLVNSKDSVFYDINKTTQQSSFPVQSLPPRFKGDLSDMINQLHKGDSVTFFVLYDSIKKYYPGEFDFKQGLDTIKYLGFAVKVDSFVSKDVFGKMKAEMQQKMEMQRQMREEEERRRKEVEQKIIPEQGKLLPLFLKKNGIPQNPDKKGIYFLEKTAGSGGLIPAGTAVSVRYTGTYLDGTIFDSNMGNPSEPPLDFVLGGGMMEGFTDCILRMRNGGKAIFVLPPDQGYNDGLYRAFEVEVVVTKPAGK